MASKAIIDRELLSLMNCINKKKQLKKDHITLDYAKHLAELEFREIRSTNPEATLADGILKAKRLYCPELFVQPAQPAQPAQPVQQAPQRDDDLLLRKYVQLQNMKKYETTDFRKSEDARIKYIKLIKAYGGGKLTQEDIDYIESLPDLALKLHKVKVSVRDYKVGLGMKIRRRRCKKCGLLK